MRSRESRSKREEVRVLLPLPFPFSRAARIPDGGDQARLCVRARKLPVYRATAWIANVGATLSCHATPYKGDGRSGSWKRADVMAVCWPFGGSWRLRDDRHAVRASGAVQTTAVAHRGQLGTTHVTRRGRSSWRRDRPEKKDPPIAYANPEIAVKMS